MSKINYSFEQWCLDNNRQDLLDRWDYELNEKQPSDVSYKSNKKYWFKCPRGIHDSQLQDVQYFASGRSKEMYCIKCRSFAQHVIDKHGEDYFEKIWNIGNVLDPWKVPYKSSKNGIFNCLENSLHIYEQTFFNRFEDAQCPYCTNHKIMKENSLGYNVPKMLPRWSDKNKNTPYDYAPKSGALVWWKCENGIHDDFQRTIANSSYRDFRCPDCAMTANAKSHIIDLTGQQIGELLVLEYDEETSNLKGSVYWKCLCSCTTIKSIPSSSLLYGGAVTCGNKSIHYTGENSPNWKGGITPEILIARTSSEYIKWRDDVYAKDWYTCQCCGESSGINKQAHHLRNFSDNEDLRYDVNNGILLCDKCHYTTIPGSFHNIYGTINNTPEQLEEYINNKRKELGIDIPFTIEGYLNGNILKPKDIKKIS